MKDSAANDVIPVGNGEEDLPSETPKPSTVVRKLENFLSVSSASELEAKRTAKLMTFSRFLYVLARNLRDDKVSQRAAALTYTSILSIFPLLVLVITFASFFFTQDRQHEFVSFIQERLYPSTTVTFTGGATAEEVTENEENLRKLQGFIAEKSDEFRNRAAGIGFIGFVGMLVAAIFLYAAIEDAFDSTWSRGRSRSIKRTIMTFSTILVLAPILVGASLGLSGVAVSLISPEETVQVATGAPAEPVLLPGVPVPPAMVPDAPPPEGSAGFRAFVRVYGAALALTPLAVNILFLMMAYMFIPQSRVKWKYALLGALCAGTLLELSKIGFTYYVFSSAVRREVFRSLGSVPVFLIWLYISWMVFLLGNEIAYCAQNFRHLVLDMLHDVHRTALDGKLIVGAMVLVYSRFQDGEGPTPWQLLQNALGLREEVLDSLVARLVSNKFLVSTGANAFSPAKPAETVRVEDLLRLGCDASRLPMAGDSKLAGASRSLSVFQDRIRAAFKGQTMAELIREQ